MEVFYIIFLILLIILIIFIRYKTPAIRGKMGEAGCAAILNMLPKDKYIVINDVMIKNGYGTSQIDHVVVSIYGIFVIETKNYSGMIYGGENSENWTKNVYGNKYFFYNPIKQNYGHKKAIKKCLGLPSDSGIIGIVAFSNKADLMVHSSSNVVNFSNLLRCIKQYKTEYFDFVMVQACANKLRNFVDYSREQKKEHVTEVRTKAIDRSNKIKNGICPQCGGKLVLRKGKYGKFYGCSNYPRCRFTKNI